MSKAVYATEFDRPIVGMKNATDNVYRVKSILKSGVGSVSIAYIPADIINPPASTWLIDSIFCAGIQRSAIIPIMAGINMDTIPWIA